MYARSLSRDPESDDSVVTLLGYSDGSTATIEYLSQASTDLPKERFEVSCGGVTAQCDNYRSTVITGRKTLKTLNQDKGQSTAVAEVIAAVRSGGPSPFGLEELHGVSRATFAITESALSGREIKLG
ncbi:MAG: hypothetical protein AAEJ52_06660 [Myxococcota bacterium]